MTTLCAKLTFFIPHADSLKDKRRVSRSLIDKTNARFNAALAEVDSHDLHRSLTVGVAVVSGENGQAERVLSEIIRFMERQGEAELIKIEQNGCTL